MPLAADPGTAVCRTCPLYELDPDAVNAVYDFPNLRAFVVTVPGREDYLAATLDSLKASDWSDDADVIVQPADQPAGFGFTSANYLTALKAGVRSGAQWVLVLEDDVAVNRYLRHNLSRWPCVLDGSLRFGSLYVPHLIDQPFGDGATRNAAGLWRAARPAGRFGPGRRGRLVPWWRRGLWGSQAYLFRRDWLRTLAAEWESVRGGQDRRALALAAKHKVPVWHPWKCLVDHTGAPSTVGSPSHRALDFDADWRVPG